MSFKAKFITDGRELNILYASYGFFTEIDPTGRPSTVTRSRGITVTVESTESSAFFEWVTDSFARKDGSIVFVKRDNDSKLKELKFTEAYLVKHNENFNAIGTNPLTETFTLSARVTEIGNGKFEQEWPVS